MAYLCCSVIKKKKRSENVDATTNVWINNVRKVNKLSDNF